MKKLNNKGFSLVELIIVIAIMAILVGVVGTQVIPYLENSRKAKDFQVISAWNTAAVSTYSTEASNIVSTAVYTIEITDGALTIKEDSTTLTNTDSIVKTFISLSGVTTSGYDFDGEMASKAGKNISSVKITINGDDGSVETVTSTSDESKYSFDKVENK